MGFPGESEVSFERTLAAVEAVRFDAAFMFLYSERSQTYASRHLPDDVASEVKKARLQRLIERQESISAEVNADLVGRRVPVLVTGPSRRSREYLTGKSDTFKSTVFPAADGIEAGDVVEVEVTATTSHTLMGSLCSRPLA